MTRLDMPFLPTQRPSESKAVSEVTQCRANLLSRWCQWEAVVVISLLTDCDHDNISYLIFFGFEATDLYTMNHGRSNRNSGQCRNPCFTCY